MTPRLLSLLAIALLTCTSNSLAEDTMTPSRDSKLQHTMAAVGIGVSDLKKSVAFYRDVLGMEERQTYKLPYMDEVVLAYPNQRGAAVVLMHWTDGSARNYKDNPVKLVLYVPDPKASAERIRAAGFAIVREPAPVPTLGNAVVGFAKDPDGYLIELLQATASK